MKSAELRAGIEVRQRLGSGRCPTSDPAVANTSAISKSGQLVGIADLAMVPPMRLVLSPPPANIAMPTSGQWSRPAKALIRGVRPNSPQTSTATSSSRPRSYRIRDQRVHRSNPKSHANDHERRQFGARTVRAMPTGSTRSTAGIDRGDARLDEHAGWERESLTRQVRNVVGSVSASGISSLAMPGPVSAGIAGTRLRSNASLCR